MAKQDDDFSAFDSVVAQPDEDFSAFDEAIKKPSLMERIGQGLKSAYDSSNEVAADVGQYGLESIADTSAGAVRGASMGALDELGGALGAGFESGLGMLGIGPSAVDTQLKAQGFDVEGSGLLDKYRQYQQGIEQEEAASEERSPILENVGQIGGSIGSSIALGGLLGVGAAAKGAQTLSQIAKNSGKAKAALELLKRGGISYAKAAPAIAAESALTSKAQLIGEDANPEAVGADVVGGLAYGLPAVLGMEAVSQAVVPSVSGSISKVKGKVADAFADEGNPRLRQMARSFTEYGENLGVNPRSHGNDIAGLKFSQKDRDAATGLVGVMDNADSTLGKAVGDSIEAATQRGAIINIDPDIQAAAKRITDLSIQLPDLGSTRKSAIAIDKVMNGSRELTPTEVKYLLDDLDAAIGTFKSATNKDAAAVGTLNELLRHRKAVSQTFKKAVPEYAQASQRFESFRNVLEQLVSGERPADITDTFYGTLRNQDQKVYDRLLDMVKNVQKDSQSSSNYRTAFTNFMDALEGFQAKEVASGAKPILPSPQSIRKTILQASDDSVLRGSVRTTTESRSIVPDIKEWVLGKAPTSGAYMLGKAKGTIKKIANKPLVNKTATLSKAVFNAPAQSVSNLASKLEASGNFKSVGKALRESLENGDTPKKNAALFTIMQNPNARLFISAEDFPDVDKEEE